MIVARENFIDKIRFSPVDDALPSAIPSIGLWLWLRTNQIRQDEKHKTIRILVGMPFLILIITSINKITIQY